MQIVLPLAQNRGGEPVYSDTDDVGVNVGVNRSGVVDRQTPPKVSKRQAWFLKQIGKGARITAEDLAAPFDVTVRTAERDIARLRDAEVIAFVGAPKTGRYIPLVHHPLDRR